MLFRVHADYSSDENCVPYPLYFGGLQATSHMTSKYGQSGLNVTKYRIPESQIR